MPSPSPIVRIPQPCPERWDAMTPTTAGRHCAACQKTVVDFTQKTDAEILAYFRQVSGEKMCGRFRTEQLARPLYPAAAASRWRTWLSAMLAVGSLGQLAASKAAAQTAVRGTAGPLPAAVSSALAPPAGKATADRPPTEPAGAARPAGSRIVSGTVYDEAALSPLPGVTVLVKGTVLGISTDKDGTFALTIPGDAPTVELVFHYIGYNSVEQTVTLADNVPLAVTLNSNGVMLSGDVVVIPATRPWPWHPRQLYYWSKYWLTRPFRH